jgi:cytochrome P450
MPAVVMTEPPRISARHPANIVDNICLSESVSPRQGHPGNPPVTFGGGGPHPCLGVHLARVDAAVAVEALLPLFAVMRLDGEPERVWTSFFNGIKRMPVSLG